MVKGRRCTRTGGKVGAKMGAVGTHARGFARLGAKDGQVHAQDVQLLHI